MKLEKIRNYELYHYLRRWGILPVKEEGTSMFYANTPEFQKAEECFFNRYYAHKFTF